MHLAGSQVQGKELTDTPYRGVSALAEFWGWWDDDDNSDYMLGNHNAMPTARTLAYKNLPAELRTESNVDTIVNGTRAVTMMPEHLVGFNRALMYMAVGYEGARQDAFEELGKMAIFKDSIETIVNLAEFVTVNSQE